jgi:DNA-binding IclR family transcriptional regulator
MAAQRNAAINSSAVHVFEVLRLVAEAEEPLGVSEISRRLGLPASTVYRALITLEDSDYLARFQNAPKYELGPLPHLLNRALVHRFKLHACSRGVLRALAESTGETVSLAVPLGWYALRLAGVYGSRDIYHRDRLGEVDLLHTSLQGLGILAFLPESDFGRYQRFVTANHPKAVPSNWAPIEHILAEAREIGFVHEVLSAGDRMTAVAFPIRNPAGEIVASLAISGPVYSPASGKSAPEWVNARASIEAEIALAPADFISPFVHVPVDEIVIQSQPRLNR